MLNIYIKLALLSSIICASCKGGANNKTQLAKYEPTNQITIVFAKNTAADTKVQTGTFNVKNQVRINYIGENLLPTEEIIYNHANNDTLRITATQSLLIEYTHLSFIKLYYYFHPGDTALFSYNQNIPDCVLSNAPTTNRYALNFFKEKELRHLPNLTPQTGMVLKKDAEALFLKTIERIELDTKFLDSLFDKKLLPKEYYTAYKKTIQYQLWNTVVNNINIYPSALKKFNEWNIGNKISNQEDVQYPIYNSFLMNYVQNFLLKGRFITVSSSQRKLDFIASFDSVQQKFTGKIKDLLLFESLLGIYETFPQELFSVYLDKYKKNNPPEAALQYIADNLLFAKDVPKGKNLLLTHDRTKVEFNELLSRYQGKVIYIDLWASWCAPCRIAFGASKKLREQLLNNQIVFIYVSLDTKLGSWTKAETEEGLLNYDHSFLLMASKEASLLKELKIEKIPRYLVIDKKGKIAYQDAPAPDSKDLRAILLDLANR